MMLGLPLFAPSALPLQSKLHSPQSISSVRPPEIINFEFFKDRLIRQANYGCLEDAISTLDFMSRSNLTPDLTTYSVLLKSCIRTRNFRLGRIVHSRVKESGLELDSIVLNSLISLYSKCGDWKTAEEIFESMDAVRDLVSWSAMISGYAHNGLNLKSVLKFYDMVELGEYPNHFCFSAALQACSNSEYARMGLVIFSFLLKTGYFESDVCVGCALIDLFVKGFCDLESAMKVFDEMPEKNSVSWTLMMTRSTQMGFPQDSIQFLLDMIWKGYPLDRFTFTSALSACSELGSLFLGQQLHSWLIKNGLWRDVCVGCSLVDMYAKCDTSMDSSRKVFDRMPYHNVMSWTAIITGYVQSGRCDKEAVELYLKILTEDRVKPNQFTFTALLKACGNLFNPMLGEQIYDHAVKLGHASDDCVGNSLISMYVKTDRMEDAQKAFELLFEKNMVSYNAIIDGYVRNMESNEAFELYNRTEYSGTGANAFTFTSLLSGAANVGAVGRGEQIHARLLKASFVNNQHVCNSLISMYARCGNIDAAHQVFSKMEDQNVISWTAIITGFAKHGLAIRALELFNQMLDFGAKPNEITYVAVLSACSHAGLIAEGWRHFHSMHKEHGIKPRMEHYACMVDLLGRSGFLDNAVQFIKSMPFTADALVWRSLLGACRVHGNEELGKHAAEMILEQDPNDPAAFVLLSNLYASSGQWEKVGMVRKGMKERNLIKEAGCSWVETANKLHKFHVGDTKHPQAKEIYKELDRLAFKIKEMGYVPDTSFVLHEVDEELKERYLFQHSEKIAVAFGCISTRDPKPIRIFKNLRVCGDCHTAMKYISLATGREIVVRDSNRFHHIKQGRCSCKDYW